MTNEVKEKQGKDTGPEENLRNVIKRRTDDKENPQLGHSEEEEGQMRRDLKAETPSLQAGGEEGDTESEKKGVTETGQAAFILRHRVKQRPRKTERIPPSQEEITSLRR